MSTSEISKCGLLTAVLMVLAQIAINIGPIPLTGAFLGIFLIGYILKPVFAFMSVLAYIILGVCGLPVFAGFKGGYGIILQATGGYLLAYPIMAVLLAFLIKKIGNRKIFTLLFSTIFAIFIGYFLGTLWLIHYMEISASKALALCVYPFIPGEIIKMALAILIFKSLEKHKIF